MSVKRFTCPWDEREHVLASDYDKLADQLRRLRKYTNHKSSCQIYKVYPISDGCSCGLDALLKELP